MSSQGRLLLELVVSCRLTVKATPLRCRLATARARMSISWRSNSSSNASRRLPRSASSADTGRCTARSASGSVGQIQAPPQPFGQYRPRDSEISRSRCRSISDRMTLWLSPSVAG